MSKQWGHGYWQGIEDATKENNGLVGLWFHSFNEGGSVNWQGQVERELEGNKYLVMTYSWLSGEAYKGIVVDWYDMVNWWFYRSSEDMNDMYYKKFGYHRG